ncbi:MAG: PAS domain S-box protein [Planctomycetota bacterium]|jgi:PAS domain S-box-containing protein
MVFRGSNKRKIMLDDRKQVEQVLRHLGVAAEQVEEGIVIIDLEGIIHFVNTAWAGMHGYKGSGEVLGRGISTFFTKEQMRKEVNRAIGEAKQKGQLTRRLEHLRKDKTTLATSTRMTVVKDDRDRAVGVVILACDVSKREQAEEELRQLREEAGQRVAQETVELTAANKKLRQEVAELKRSQETLVRYSDEEEAAEGEIELFTSEKLKALSDLAKRLGSE